MGMRHCPTCDGMHTTRARCPQAAKQAQATQARTRPTTTARGYDTAWQRVRLQVLTRDGRTCRLRLPGCTTIATTVDHLVPLARGGPRLDPHNLAAACAHCNAAKRDRWIPGLPVGFPTRPAPGR